MIKKAKSGKKRFKKVNVNLFADEMEKDSRELMAEEADAVSDLAEDAANETADIVEDQAEAVEEAAAAMADKIQRGADLAEAASQNAGDGIEAADELADPAGEAIEAAGEVAGAPKTSFKDKLAALHIKEGFAELKSRITGKRGDGEEEVDSADTEAGAEELKGRNTTEAMVALVDEDGNPIESGLSEEEEMELLLKENTGKKKLTKKQLAIRVGIGAACAIALLALVIINLGGDDGEQAYVESVRMITGLGSANGMANRYTGIVEAQDSWDVTLDDGMVVEECFVKVGDEVKTGDKLLQYNTEELTLAKEKLELEVSTLESENAQLNKDITSYQNDLKNASAREKIQLQTEILTAQTTIKKNQYTIKSDKEGIENLQKNIKDATVTSKMDGVVKTVNKQIGGQNDGQDNYYEEDMGNQEGIYMTILAVGDYRIKGKISETNVWELSEGDEMIVRSRVDDSKVWHGTVESIRTDATSDEGESYEEDYYGYQGESASTYDFFIELEDSSNLMMGQHVLIEVNYGQENDVEGTWLPAVYIHEQDGKYYVWKANARDRLVLQEIEVGDYDEEMEQYQVLKGIDLEDYIACDADNLHENMRITKNDPALSTEDFGDEGFDDEFMGDDEESYYYEGSDDGFEDSDFAEDYNEEDY